MYLMMSILLYILSVQSLLTIIYSFYLIITVKTIAMQFNWLITSYIYAILLYAFILFNHTSTLNFNHIQYIMIYLFLVDFLYLALFFSKFNKVFSNILNKKLYFYFIILSIFALLSLIIFLIINGYGDADRVVLSHNYIQFFQVPQNYSIIFLVFSPIVISIFSMRSIIKTKLLKSSIKKMYSLYFLQLFCYIMICIFNYPLIQEILLTMGFLSKLVFNIFLIYNLIIEKGRYLTDAI